MQRLAFAVLLLAAACSKGSSWAADYESWFVVKVNGARAGFAHERRATTGSTIVTTAASEMRIKRMGDVTLIAEETTFEETTDGKPLRFRYRAKLAAGETVQTGEIRNGKLDVTLRAGGTEEKKTHDWSDEYIFPAALERLAREKGLKDGTRFTYKSWNPQFGRPVAYSVRVGKDSPDMRVVTTLDALPGVEQIQWVGSDHRIKRSSMKIMGMDIATESATREAALLDTSGDMPDILVASLLKPKRRLDDPRKVARATYRITFREGEARDQGLRWDGQTVERVDARTLTVTVDPPRPVDGTRRPIDDAKLRDYLAETAILQVGDPKIQAAAREAVGDETDAWKAARRMESWVREKISKRNFGVGFATAKEVAERLEGDCTEHAVLLAAMARAAGIPSRIAVGLVGVQDFFGGHMWTEVWIGRWVPLDATLAGQEFDATHIKMGESIASGMALQNDLLDVLLYLGRMDLEIVDVKTR